MKPTDPLLEVTVSGNVVTAVKPGDWVLVTCQASGGHPVADIGLTLDGAPAGSKDFRNLKNSFTFTASEEDNGKTILCTAVNKVGTTAVSSVLHVHGEIIIISIFNLKILNSSSPHQSYNLWSQDCSS